MDSGDDATEISWVVVVVRFKSMVLWFRDTASGEKGMPQIEHKIMFIEYLQLSKLHNRAPPLLKPQETPKPLP